MSLKVDGKQHNPFGIVDDSRLPQDKTDIHSVFSGLRRGHGTFR